MQSSFKRLLCLCLCFALVLVLLPGFRVKAAEKDPLEYLSYSIADGAVTITDCSTTATGRLEIPDTIEGLPVTTIGAYAFSFTNLTELVIAASVTDIGTYALSCSRLQSIVFLGDPPNYEEYAFGKDYWYGCFGGTVYFPIHNSKWPAGFLESLKYQDADIIPRYWEATHSWDQGTQTAAATCTAGGSILYACTVCSVTETKTTAPLPHSWDGGAVISQPTCTQSGKRLYTCTLCGESYKSNYGNATGHTAVTDSAVEATCTAGGLTEGSHCDTCGQVLTAQEVVPATGHRYETVVADPTCTEDGSVTDTCMHCGDVTHEILPATGHRYETVVVDPTCTKDGSITATCMNCGDVIPGILPATGHQFEDNNCIHCGEPEGIMLPGDVNGDGHVNIADVAYLYAHIKNTAPIVDEAQFLRTDVNSDGVLNIGDVGRLYAHVKGTNPLA